MDRTPSPIARKEGILQKIKRTEMYYRDMDLITSIRGPLRQQMQKRPIAEVHMKGLTTREWDNNFYTESRINSMFAKDKRSKDAQNRQIAQKVFQAT